MLPGLQSWGSQPRDYTGASYIGPGAAWDAGMAGMGGWHGGAGQEQVVDPALSQWRNLLDPGSFMNAPGASAPLDWFSQQVGRNLDENIRPGYASGAIQAGQYGGLSSELAQQNRIAERDAAEAIAGFGQQLTGDLWQRGLDASGRAVGAAPGMYQFGMAPYQGQLGLDQLQRGEQYTEQGMGNAARDFEQNEPFTRYRDMFSILGPAANLGGTMTGSTTQEQQLGWGNFVGPAMSLGMGMATGGVGGLGGLGGFGSFNSWNPGLGYYNTPNLMAGPFPGSYGR